jgi:hypothetical protein
MKLGSAESEEKVCQERKVFKDGKEVYVSPEMRRKLYGVISYLPLKKVLDKGYTPEDRKKLDAREAAAVSMLDPRILKNTEFQEEVKGYLLERAQLEQNFPVGDLERDPNALYALFYLAHECVKNYKPVKEKENIYERAERGQGGLKEELFGKKKTRSQ